MFDKDVIEGIFQRHEEVILFYSGGKDSLALLLRLKPYWNRVNVVWVDTGNQFPEVIEHMGKVMSMVPHFTTLRGNIPEYFLKNGFPVDVVPTRYTRFGQFAFGEKPLTVCSRFDCCNANIWAPMRAYLAAVKPTCVLRADRQTERIKGPENEDGIEFVFPIWEWTDEQVWRYLQGEAGDLLQERHCMKHGTSLDCQTCMAYNEEIPERLTYLKKEHPALYEKTVRFYESYKAVVVNEIKKIEV
ncbi:phosphoadenosine phosphosulfate reductase family protein [uncultured Parasutterella sp.]|uniref:phosphoadenosine phosphosulfate reductase family protein n=1 Tax=uncultured Parasutterella sp. TaxID=1263098 RepID=UPI002593CA6D|nr:phosphoadenosine phosphosulfate reductase family protein [uncultured Parasutterella sp.]